MAEALICDACGEATKRRDLLDWLTIHTEGADGTPFGTSSLDRTSFCGESCLLEHLGKRQAARSANQARARERQA